MRIWRRPVLKVLLINCAMQMEICLIIHQKVVLACLDFQSIFPENDDKIVSTPLCPNHSKNAHSSMCMGEDSGHYEGCAKHSCQTSLTVEQDASDCGLQTLTLAQCSWVCKLKMADQVAFYMWQSLLHATALPIHCILKKKNTHTHTRACARMHQHTHLHLRAHTNTHTQ
jgi:hypothetical protein